MNISCFCTIIFWFTIPLQLISFSEGVVEKSFLEPSNAELRVERKETENLLSKEQKLAEQAKEELKRTTNLGQQLKKALNREEGNGNVLEKTRQELFDTQLNEEQLFIKSKVSEFKVGELENKVTKLSQKLADTFIPSQKDTTRFSSAKTAASTLFENMKQKFSDMAKNTMTLIRSTVIAGNEQNSLINDYVSASNEVSKIEIQLYDTKQELDNWQKRDALRQEALSTQPKSKKYDKTYVTALEKLKQVEDSLVAQITSQIKTKISEIFKNELIPFNRFLSDQNLSSLKSVENSLKNIDNTSESTKILEEIKQALSNEETIYTALFFKGKKASPKKASPTQKQIKRNNRKVYKKTFEKIKNPDPPATNKPDRSPAAQSDNQQQQSPTQPSDFNTMAQSILDTQKALIRTIIFHIIAALVQAEKELEKEIESIKNGISRLLSGSKVVNPDDMTS